MHLAARPQQRVKIGSRDGGGKSYNLDVVTRVKQPSAARAHDAGHQYPLLVGRHARPRPKNAIALRIRVLQAEPMDKFEELVDPKRTPDPAGSSCEPSQPTCGSCSRRVSEDCEGIRPYNSARRARHRCSRCGCPEAPTANQRLQNAAETGANFAASRYDAIGTKRTFRHVCSLSAFVG